MMPMPKQQTELYVPLRKFIASMGRLRGVIDQNRTLAADDVDRAKYVGMESAYGHALGVAQVFAVEMEADTAAATEKDGG